MKFAGEGTRLQLWLLDVVRDARPGCPRGASVGDR